MEGGRGCFTEIRNLLKKWRILFPIKTK